jgi:WD40 repeat protein
MSRTDSTRLPRLPHIPDHELVRPIGEGAYGEVWLARSKATGRYRAVKIVYRARFTNEEPYETEFSGVRRFEEVSREHEGFVDILHVSRDDEAQYFAYVMELADDRDGGPPIDPAAYMPRTLARELEARGRLDPAECVKVGVALASALADLHRRSLVHRDVKPSNIVFVRGAPKLADVGLVTEIKSQAGTLIGSPAYMDTAVHGTAQGDLFGLGKVLYVMATGLKPEDWPTWPAEAEHLAKDQAFHDLGEVFVKACHTNRARRYRSAEEMLAELVVLRAGSSVRRLRRIERWVTAVKRYGAVAALLLGLAGLAGYQWSARSKQARALRQRQVSSYLAYGARALEENDLIGSLPWFAQAFRLDQANPRNEATHRLRLGAVLQRAPALVQMFFCDFTYSHASFAGQEHQILAPGRAGRWGLYDLPSGQLLSSTLFGTGSRFENAAISPATRLAVTAQNDTRQVLLWDSGTGQKLRTFTYTTNVYSATISRDGQWVAAAAWDMCAVVWATQTGERQAVLSRHQKPLTRVAFSPSARQLASASSDGTALVWELPSGRLLRELTNHTKTVYQAAFSPDETRLATASGDRTARVFDLNTGLEVVPPLRHGGTVGSLHFSSDGERLVTAAWDAVVRVWDARTGDMLLACGHNATTFHAEFSPQGRFIVTACADGAIRVFDVRRCWMRTAPQPVYYCRDGSRFLRLTNLTFTSVEGREEKELGSGTLSHPWLMPPVWSDDGSRFLTLESPAAGGGAPPAQARLWVHTPNGLQSRSVPFDGRLTNLVVLSRNGQRLAACSRSEWAVWDLESGGRLLSATQEVSAAAFDPSGQSLAAASSNIVQLWNLTTGRPWLEEPWRHATAVASVEWSRDGKYLVTACWEANVSPQSSQVIEAYTGRFIGPALAHRDGIRYATFSPDGHAVITCGEDCLAVLWEVGTGRLLTPPLRHKDQVLHAAFSRDSRWVATACRDGTVRIWDAETGEPLTAPVFQDADLRSVQFVNGDRALLTRSADGMARVWKLPHEDRSVEEVVKIAELLSSRQSHSIETLLPQTRDALRRLWKELSERYPAEFSLRSE